VIIIGTGSYSVRLTRTFSETCGKKGRILESKVQSTIFGALSTRIEIHSECRRPNRHSLLGPDLISMQFRVLLTRPICYTESYEYDLRVL